MLTNPWQSVLIQFYHDVRVQTALAFGKIDFAATFDCEGHRLQHLLHAKQQDSNASPIFDEPPKVLLLKRTR